MEVGMERPLPLVGHQNFHLSNGKVLDVLVLSPRLLDFRLTAEYNGFIFFFKNAYALDRECAPLLPYAGRRLQEVLRPV